MRKSQALLAAKIALLLASVYLLVYLPGALVQKGLPWRSSQDPRARLVWDHRYDGSPLVLLGDSEFCSFYVNRPDDTLWSRLARDAGRTVYNGALNGAKEKDLIGAARFVARNWPEGSVVFLDLVPTRFLASAQFPEPDANYRELFRRLDPPPAAGALGRVEALKDALLDSLFLYNYGGETLTYLGSLVRPAQYYGTGVYRDRVWSSSGDLALTRYRLFEQIAARAEPRGFEMTDTVSGILRARRLAAVFVLTPLNRELMKSYASDPASLRKNQELLDEVHLKLVSHLRERGIDYVDLYDKAGPDCFCDLVHTNSRGEELIAAALALWLKTHGR